MAQQSVEKLQPKPYFASKVTQGAQQLEEAEQLPRTLHQGFKVLLIRQENQQRAMDKQVDDALKRKEQNAKADELGSVNSIEKQWQKVLEDLGKKSIKSEEQQEAQPVV